MEQFRAKFIEDATDLLNDLENDLLVLEETPNNSEMLEEVYRVMHTLKGVSAMYGFEYIGNLTHDLESIYDYVLKGKVELTTEILTLTLDALDVIRKLLQKEDPYQDTLDAYYDTLERIKIVILQIQAQIASEVTIETEQKESQNDEDNNNKIKTYYLLFKPDSSLFKRGVNPYAIIEELCELGECKVISHSANVPKINLIDPLLCYYHWEIFLATNASFEEIEDVFIFVPEEYKIHKLFGQNLLHNAAFINKVESTCYEQESLDFIELQEFIANLKIPHITANSKKKKEANTSSTFSDKNTSSIKVSSEKLDDLMNLVSELVTSKAEISLIAKELKTPKLTRVAEKFDKLSRLFRDTVLDIRLVPVDTMLVRFKRLVRDLSQEFSKEIIFTTEGTETEIDKTIIAKLANPLMHIFRNSIDHGIEPKEERIARGKPKQGKIHLAAHYSGANVIIRITDDGRGLNAEKIRNKAIEKGLILPETQLTEKEIINLVFTSGFSTADKVSEISGRGVGMDIVRKRIGEVRGEVEIQSEQNIGTTITIKLPLTLSIVDTLLVKIANSHYLIPLTIINHSSEIRMSEINTTNNNRIVLDNEMVSYINLRKEFEIHEAYPEVSRIVVINYDDRKVALLVDVIIGEHQAVLKPLGEVFKKQEMISGASILGDGSVALVLDTDKLIKQHHSANSVSVF